MNYDKFTPDELARARTRWDVIGRDVPLKRAGRELAGRCPFHAEKTPSFYVAPDHGFFHCFGCGAHGTAIDYVIRVRGVNFVAAVRELLDLPPQPQRAAVARPQAPIAGKTPDEDRERVAEVLAGCGPITPTTAAHIYLLMRGLSPRQPDLRAHPGLYCHEVRDHLPALVAPIVDRNRVVTAVQRIWLARTVVSEAGTSPADNRAPLRTRKKSLGVIGDGAVQLGEAAPQMGLAEGVETAIGAMRDYCVPVWATCGVGRFGFPAHWRSVVAPGQKPDLWIAPMRPPAGIEARFVPARPPAVWLPPIVEHLLIFADTGPVGEVAAEHAANFYAGRGIGVEVVIPDAGTDFNDQRRAHVAGKQHEYYA